MVKSNQECLIEDFNFEPKQCIFILFIAHIHTKFCIFFRVSEFLSFVDCLMVHKINFRIDKGCSTTLVIDI